MKRIAIIGAGAIGGVTAALMKKAGWDPVLVCRRQEIVDRIETTGLSIQGFKGAHRVRLQAVCDIEDLPQKIEIAFLATKANDCQDAAKRLLGHLLPDGRIVSLQNGIAEAALAEVAGAGRIIGCVVGWGATHLGPGRLEVTSPGEFIVGNWDAQAGTKRLENVRAMLSAVQPTRTSDNIIGELYGKLIINACINSLGVIAGIPLGKLLARSRVRRLFIALMREAMALADAMGIHVEPAAGGKLDYYRFLEGDGLPARIRRDLFIRIIGFKYRRIRSSSLQSIERGRPTEIDFLNGYICEKAREHGIPVPYHDAVVQWVHQIEAGQRPISPANLNDPVFDAR